MTRARSKVRAFSLVELVIVVVIIGVIAAIAVPRISRGAKGAGDASLRGSLAGLRNAIDMYAAEHGGAFPGADSLEATLIDQLTKITDAQGNVAPADATHIYGPYLRGSSFPKLPVCVNKGSSAVKFVTGTPVGGTGTEGWVYSTDTGALIANCGDVDPKDTDERGVKYNTY